MNFSGLSGDNMMVVYIITNKLDGKYYVGRDKNVTSKWNRWKQHRYEAKKGCNFYVHKALREIGIDQFVFEIITEAYSFNELINLEKLWIIALRAHDPAHGYNMTIGGEGAGYGHLSVEVRKEIGRRISESNTGRKQSPEERKMRSEIRTGASTPTEVRIKIGNSQRRTKHNYPKRKKKFTEEHNKNISICQRNRICITDGTSNRRIKKEEVIPKGWKRGRVGSRSGFHISSSHQQSLLSSIKDTIFITREEESIRIHKDSPIPEGWVKGKAKLKKKRASPKFYHRKVEPLRSIESNARRSATMKKRFCE